MLKTFAKADFKAQYSLRGEKIPDWALRAVIVYKTCGELSLLVHCTICTFEAVKKIEKLWNKAMFLQPNVCFSLII